MDFIESIGDTITAKGREAVDKARELAEIAHLKGQITTCEEVIKKNYLEIGRLYCELYGEEPQEEFKKQCSTVKNAQNGIADIQRKIREVKGI